MELQEASHPGSSDWPSIVARHLLKIYEFYVARARAKADAIVAARQPIAPLVVVESVESIRRRTEERIAAVRVGFAVNLKCLRWR